MGNDESKQKAPRGILSSFNNNLSGKSDQSVYTNSSKTSTKTLTEKIEEIVTINKESKVDYSDPLLDELKAIPPFIPLIKSNFTFEKHNLDNLDSASLLEMCRLYQKFLRKTTILIVKEQRLIISNIKTFETIAGKCLSNCALKSAEVKKFEFKFRDINSLGKQLLKVRSLVDNVIESIQRVNLLLPIGDRLEELKFSAVETETTSLHHHACSEPNSSKIPYPISGSAAEKGARSTMEDCHINYDCMKTVTQDIICGQGLPPHISFYAVYDGHGGIHAARFLSKHLHDSIFFSTHMEEGKIPLAIKHGFLSSDVKILELSAKEGWRSGSTAAIIIIVDSHIYSGNVGDSETVLGRKIMIDDHVSYESILLTEKHKPNDPSERSRIEKAGGSVYFNRVCGSLAVSRAFGDADFKRPFNEAIGSFVIADPSINSLELEDHDEFFIIACDGLWDVMKYHEVIEYIGLRKKNNAHPDAVAKELAHIAIKQRGSSDNVSCIVVYLK